MLGKIKSKKKKKKGEKRKKKRGGERKRKKEEKKRRKKKGKKKRKKKKAKGKGARVDEIIDSNTNSIDTILIKLQDITEDTGAWFAVSHGVTKNWL